MLLQSASNFIHEHYIPVALTSVRLTDYHWIIPTDQAWLGPACVFLAVLL
jgi:hypothetical protein